MKIAHFIPNSLIDYPNKVAAVFYTQGCNMACGFCQNATLIPKDAPNLLEGFDLIGKLKSSIGFLDGVVVTGGEPTLQPDLPAFLASIRTQTPLSIKLDTNGTHPEVLEHLFAQKLVDFVAMDIKAPLQVYPYRQMAGNMVDQEMIGKMQESVRLIKASGVPHEFRTTVVRPLLGERELLEIGQDVAACQRYALQTYDPEHARLATFRQYDSYPPQTLSYFADLLREQFGIEEVVTR